MSVAVDPEQVADGVGELLLQHEDEPLALCDFRLVGPVLPEPPGLRHVRTEVGHQPVDRALVGHDPAPSAGSKAGPRAEPGSGSIGTRGSLRSPQVGRVPAARPTRWRIAWLVIENGLSSLRADGLSIPDGQANRHRLITMIRLRLGGAGMWLRCVSAPRGVGRVYPRAAVGGSLWLCVVKT